MSEEVKELIDTLKEYADGFTGVLAPTEESVKALLDYIDQLETNKNKLEMWLESCINELKENDVYDRTSYEQGQIIALESFIAEMQELERGKE